MFMTLIFMRLKQQKCQKSQQHPLLRKFFNSKFHAYDHGPLK